MKREADARRFTVGARLRQAREEAGLTQTDLGRMFGITDVTIGQWEGGHIKKVDMARLEAFARALGKPLDYFFSDEALLPPRPPEVVYAEIGRYLVAVPLFTSLGGVPARYLPVDFASEQASMIRAYAIKGLSCEPDIRDGDIIFVAKNIKPAKSDIALYSRDTVPLLARGIFEDTQRPGRLLGVVVRIVRDIKRL